jgi:pimeloyl-ACP methyl ester carboxylesterase
VTTAPDPTLATTRDGRWLRYETAGSGSPAVVFESGMGGSRRSWVGVAPLVAERTATIVYDRSGLGGSPPDQAPRTVERMAQDLEDLLVHLGDDPVVLVGHSYGGPITRSVLATAPERVAGLVLVDPTDEGCPLYFDPKAMRPQVLMGKVLPFAARTGLMRLVTGRMARDLPEDQRRAFVDADSTVAAARGMQAEMAPLMADMVRLRDEPLPTIEVPLTIITGTKAGRGRQAQQQRTALGTSHRARVAASPEGRHVEASRSGHMVNFTEPALIADEVLRVVDLVRDEGR